MQEGVPFGHADQVEDHAVGEQAESVAHAFAVPVADEVGGHVVDGLLAEVAHLVVQDERHLVAVLGAEELQAEIAAAAPAFGVGADLFADVPEIAGIPVGLVEEEDVGALVDGDVDPFVQPVHQLRLVEAGDAHLRAVGEHLADIGFPGDELAQRFAAEDAGHAPGIDLHLQPELVRDAVDLAHGFLAPEEVAFGRAMDDVVETGRGDVLQIGGHMPQGAIAEIGNAGAHRCVLRVVTPADGAGQRAKRPGYCRGRRVRSLESGNDRNLDELDGQ